MTKQPYDTGALDLVIRKYIGRMIDKRVEELRKARDKAHAPEWLPPPNAIDWNRIDGAIFELLDFKEEINSELGEVEKCT